MLDWLVKSGTVVDGTGAPTRPGDVGIRGDAIVLDGLRGAQAKRELDAAGLVVAPGFIDTHTHSDLFLLTDTDHSAKLCQGVTTEVIGLDGISFAPLSPPRLAEMLEYGSGIDGLPPEGVRWEGVAEFLDLLDGAAACNVVYMVPHGALRIEAMGWERRPAQAGDVARMRRLLTQALEEGGRGLSVGLTYAPGEFAETEKLAALAEVAAQHGGLYVPHERFHRGDLLNCTAETLEVCRRSGCSALISHLFVLPRFAGRAPELLQSIDSARAEGLDVQFDAHPYLEGNSWLAAVAPAWLAEGGPHTVRSKLSDSATRKRLVDESAWDWDQLVISGIAGGDPEGLAGRSVVEIAEDRGQIAPEAFCDLLSTYGWSITAITGGREPTDVPPIITHPSCMICTDGILVGPRPHPRGFGCFPRILREYWRERRLLSLEEAVHKMTGLPADRLGIPDRGRIEEGARADLVLLEPESVADRNSMGEPQRRPVGIPYVFVNGQLAVNESERTTAVAGRVLR